MEIDTHTIWRSVYHRLPNISAPFCSSSVRKRRKKLTAY